MRSDLVGVTYLLHFERPISHAQHYLGWTNDLDARMKQHRNGSRERCVLTFVARERGIGLILARVWEGVTIDHEKRMKRRRNARRMCPICNPDGWHACRRIQPQRETMTT